MANFKGFIYEIDGFLKQIFKIDGFLGIQEPMLTVSLFKTFFFKIVGEEFLKMCECFTFTMSIENQNKKIS